VVRTGLLTKTLARRCFRLVTCSDPGGVAAQRSRTRAAGVHSGARDRGARCDEIPHSLPGVGYVEVDGQPEPVRVRFGYVTDDHIRALAAGWRPLTALPEIEDDAA
jgi:hypothetical protein